MHTEISLNLLDNKQTEENLHMIVTETRDLVAPLLRSVSICTRVEDAFRQAHVIIVLDEVTDQEVHTLEDCIRSRLPLCRLYGYLIEKNAHDSVRVIVGGKTFVNLKTVLLMRYAPNVAHNIIAVALGVEGRARAVLARKLRTTPSCEWASGSGSGSGSQQHHFRAARKNTVPFRIILDIWTRKYEADTKNSLLCDLTTVQTLFFLLFFVAGWLCPSF